MSDNSHVLEVIQGVIARHCLTTDSDVAITLINKLQCNYICLQVSPEQMITQCEAFILPSLSQAKSSFVLTVEANLQGININYWVDANPNMHTIDIHGLLATREPVSYDDIKKQHLTVQSHKSDIIENLNFLSEVTEQNYGFNFLSSGEQNHEQLTISDMRQLSGQALLNSLSTASATDNTIKLCSIGALSDLQEHQLSTQAILVWPFFDTDLIAVMSTLQAQSRLSVLVADDSLPSQVATKVMLEMLGCSVTCAENGSSALLIAQKEPFDLLLLDERMPGMFGSDVAQQLNKQNTPNNETPKVILTGITEEQEIAQLFEKGVTHYLQKPVTKAVLEEFIKPWQAA